MKLTFSISRSDWSDFYIAVTPLGPTNPLFYYSWGLLVAALLFTLACFAMVSMDIPFLAIVAAGAGAYTLWGSIPYSRRVKRVLETRAARHTPHDVILELTDEGLTETAFGICSIAPWTSVLHVKKYQRIILVGLTSGRYSIIPRSAAASQGKSEDEIIRFVDERIQKAKG